MSPLAAFFKDHPERRRIHLARDVGISPGFVTQLCAGGKPGRALAVRISEWTGGKVRPEDWDDRAETAPFSKSSSFQSPVAGV